MVDHLCDRILGLGLVSLPLALGCFHRALEARGLRPALAARRHARVRALVAYAERLP